MPEEYCVGPTCGHPKSDHHHGICGGHIKAEKATIVSCKCREFLPKREDASQAAARTGQARELEVAEKQTRKSRIDAEATAARAGTGLMRQMPLYQCHYKVWALKIAAIETQDLMGARITPAEEGYLPFLVDTAYMAQHEPEVGGYFVQYEDGHKSFSPAKAFEDGYTPIEPNAPNLAQWFVRLDWRASDHSRRQAQEVS